MHPNFAAINEELAKFTTPDFEPRVWMDLARNWLTSACGSLVPQYAPQVPTASYQLLGWDFSSDFDTDNRKPIGLNGMHGTLTAIAPGIVLFEAYGQDILGINLFGLVEQIAEHPHCFRIHILGDRQSTLYLVGNDPEHPAIPSTDYHEVVYVAPENRSKRFMISDSEWDILSDWLLKWLAIPHY